MCVFPVLGGLESHEARIIIGVWVAECVYFSCFGDIQTHEAAIIIGVWVDERAYFSCLEALARTKPL